MRFLLSVPPFTDPAVVVRWAREAEASGWDGFFVWDHLSWDGTVDVHDPWVLLGAIAAETSRIRIGTLVTPISRRRPQVLAKHLTTLDHLSGGRVTVGIGLGDPPDLDFSDFGDEPSYRRRGAITDEALTVLGDLLGEGGSRFHGEHLEVSASLRPRPVQRPRPPIWIAGRHPSVPPLERAKRWDGFAPLLPETLSPAEIAAYVGDRPRADWDLVVPWWKTGTVDDYAAAGVTWLVRSVWPREEGWRDELEELVAAPPG
ncbi:MAG TPA: LLM class flavin-dependent oxidoreductase [Nocardioides sp.]|jgi:alkanesulfonate monooxygenase SsuD/methylene tetrahydromethanopterin reductase-like flavin-dependent oxidoreductase (luciferase family)|nr:LLM class flavin-dependent oxidoreductase [Nocardioides sp.]